MSPSTDQRQRRSDLVKAESARAASRRWKARNRERMRAYDRLYSLAHRGTCARCGGLMGLGSGDGVCRACRIQAKKERRELIQRLWAEGAKIREIAVALGSTPNAVGVEMAQMRADGWDLPRRYQSRRVAA